MLVETPVNLLVKLTNIRLGGGPWGGLPPSSEASPRLHRLPEEHEAYETYETV